MNDLDKTTLRENRGALEQALRDAGAEFKGRAILCPFHDDHSPSGSIYRGDDGAWRFRCHGCDVCEDVIGVQALAQNRKAGDVLRDAGEQQERRPARKVYATLEALEKDTPGVEQVYVYAHPATKKPELVVLRCRLTTGEKKFLQAQPVPGGFSFGGAPKPWPIYNRSRVVASPAVVVVEGEKCVHALTPLGIVATTSPGGAGKGALADWSLLAGRSVYLWPDRDEVGIEHMREVGEILRALNPAPKLFWIEPANLDLPEKGDAADFVERMGADPDETKKLQVQVVLTDARPLGAADDLRELIEDTIAGKRKCEPWPWKLLDRMTRALVPGTVTAICGDPGSTKSFLLLQAAWYWHQENIKAAIFELEDSREYHLLRALAQMAGDANLTDPTWMQANPEQSRIYYQATEEFMAGFAATIHAAPDKQITLPELAAWVERMAQAGCRIIGIDPVTFAAVSEKPWIDDLKFIVQVKTTCRRHGCSLILVTHPRKGRGRHGSSGLDDLAGGAAYPRFAQTVLWIDRHDKPQSVKVKGENGLPFHPKINRSIHLRKTRNGRGAGMELGYVFDGKTLCFAEQGVVIGDAEDAADVDVQ